MRPRPPGRFPEFTGANVFIADFSGPYREGTSDPGWSEDLLSDLPLIFSHGVAFGGAVFSYGAQYVGATADLNPAEDFTVHVRLGVQGLGARDDAFVLQVPGVDDNVFEIDVISVVDGSDLDLDILVLTAEGSLEVQLTIPADTGEHDFDFQFEGTVASVYVDGEFQDSGDFDDLVDAFGSDLNVIVNNDTGVYPVPHIVELTVKRGLLY